MNFWLAAVFLSCPRLEAQSTATVAPAAPEVVPFVRNVSRLESWSFFEPHSPASDPDYSLFSNRLTFGMRVNKRRIAFESSLQYAQVFGLPRRATGPGPLGPGAMYFAAARTPAALQLYFKSLLLRINDITPGMSLQVGRMTSSGVSGSSPSSGAQQSHSERLRTRLMGDVEWSTFERAFDGVRLDGHRTRWQWTAALLFPSQGAFEESANPTIGSVRVASASVTVGATGTARASRQLQVFAHYYNDRRDITTRPDNTGLQTSTADISMATVGASHIGVYSLRWGEFDTVAWLAGQVGDWYADAHRAFSGTAEAGHQWSAGWQPRLGVGVLYASGDADPTDTRHGTFFPMLASTEPALFAATFAQMNVRHLHANIRLHPRSWLVLSTEVHRMSLARASDHWYSGTGATARRGEFFGYIGRPSGGATRLAALAQIAAEATVRRRWTLKAAIGVARGGGVVRRLFANNRLSIVAIESALAF